MWREIPIAAGRLAAALASLAFLAPSVGPHSVALGASASALALLVAGLLRYAKTVISTEPVHVARAVVATRSSSCELVALPQRDPDAAGKQRSRAPGSRPSAV
jgi:uncharacterized protein DUF6412